MSSAEESVATLVGTSYSGGAAAEEPTKFEFDADFQTKLAAHTLRDLNFMRRVAHLIKPDYFENVGEAAMVNIGLRYWKKYQQVPDSAAAALLFKEDIAAKVIRGDVKDAAKEAFVKIYKHPISGGMYASDKVAEFARHQAVGQAILDSVDLLSRKDFSKIAKVVKSAIEIGVNEDGEEYDYFARITERTEERQDRAAGKLPPTGITTGVLKMDELLYHRGWGRRELSIIMGGAKAGKTTALIGFAKSASLAGHNVLYVTLEVAAKIISERLDASISDNMVKELGTKIHDVRTKIEALQSKSGKLMIHEYPSGTFTPSMLRGLLDRYDAKGVRFDLVVVDYADIMAPDYRYNDAIENSKQVYVGLRAIAHEYNVAMLSATQTNREGFKSAVAKAEHVAEDFNKVRIADIMISINITDEERAAGEARLYFAASRNQESGFTIFVKQNIAKMKFIESILRIE